MHQTKYLIRALFNSVDIFNGVASATLYQNLSGDLGPRISSLDCDEGEITNSYS